MEENDIELQKQIYCGIMRSATIVLSTHINLQLNIYFNVYDIILIVFAMHAISNTISSLPGFNASWNFTKDIIQYIVLHRSVTYVIGDSENDELTFVKLLGLLIISECISERFGWVGNDIVSFKSNLMYIFSDRISNLLNNVHIPLVMAVLGISFADSGFIGTILVMTGVNALCSFLFDAIYGGELSLVWPLLLLYFVHEIVDKEMMKYPQIHNLLDFGLFKASEATYSGLLECNISSSTLGMGFVLLTDISPKDPIWTGICVLVSVRSISDWFLQEIAMISQTDPVFVGLIIVTTLHFIAIAFNF